MRRKSMERGNDVMKALLMSTGLTLIISTLLVAALLSGMCLFWVWMEGKSESDD